MLQNSFFFFRNTTIVVELENVNDNTPSFTQQKFFFTVTEVRFTLCLFLFRSSPRRVNMKD